MPPLPIAHDLVLKVDELRACVRLATTAIRRLKPGQRLNTTPLLAKSPW